MMLAQTNLGAVVEIDGARYAVVGRGYHLTRLVRLDAHGVPVVGTMGMLADCVECRVVGMSPHVDPEREDTSPLFEQDPGGSPA